MPPNIGAETRADATVQCIGSLMTAGVYALGQVLITMATTRPYNTVQKHFNAPLSISIENTSDYIRVFVLNDLNESKTVDAEYEIFDFENGTLETNKKH